MNKNERSGFFDSKPIIDNDGNYIVDEDGMYIYDRQYTSSEFAELFEIFLTSGIRNAGTNLKVVGGNGNMSVTILPGDAMIRGYYYKLVDEPKELEISNAHNSYKRIDRAVIRLNLNENEGRNITACIKKGNASNNPVPPELERSNSIYELSLAEITIYPNTKQILITHIKDTRLDNKVCGLINSLIGFDTSEMFSEIDEYANTKKQEWDKETKDLTQWCFNTKEQFLKWYKNISDDYSAWYKDIKATIFDDKYVNFDNWIYRDGFTYEIVHEDNGSVKQIIKNTLSGKEVGSKYTKFSKDNIIEEIKLNDDKQNINMRKTTYFNNGSISEKIEKII